MPNPNFPTSNTPSSYSSRSGPLHSIYHALELVVYVRHLFLSRLGRAIGPAERRGERDGWEKWGNKWPAKAFLLLQLLQRGRLRLQSQQCVTRRALFFCVCCWPILPSCTVMIYLHRWIGVRVLSYYKSRVDQSLAVVKRSGRDPFSRPNPL